MRGRIYGWTALLAVAMMLAPAAAPAQDITGYALPAQFLPTPLASTRPEEGLFFYGTFALYVQRVPLPDQQIAVRGFADLTGEFQQIIVPVFAGSGEEALNTHQVTGPQSQQPGWSIGGGYRFFDGGALDLHWLHLATQKYTAVATPVPQSLNFRPDLLNTFLFAPVNNFPLDFAGPSNDVSGVGAFGVWNAADLMTLEYTQRNEIIELTYRFPALIDQLNWRTYAFVGPRFVWFWERLKWRTFDADDTGNADPVFQALYTNIVSNRMYGLKVGCGNDWYIGNGLAVTLELWATPMMNIVKKRAKYERGDRGFGPERKRSDTDYTLVGEASGALNLSWFPYEGIQVKAGYNLMNFFNVVEMETPVDFDYNAVNPEYGRGYRWLRGFEIGVMIRF